MELCMQLETVRAVQAGLITCVSVATGVSTTMVQPKRALGTFCTIAVESLAPTQKKHTAQAKA
eukprot:5528808-Alexandrium_andersonii.AAC.1